MSTEIVRIEDVDGEISDLRHMALRNALYHVARRRWLDGWSRFFNLLTILAGTGIAADLTKGNGQAALVLGGLVTISGALQLVYDFTGRARLHEILQRRYFTLMADIECAASPTGDQCRIWRSEFSRASADEPPTMRALDSIAHNQATFALIGGTEPYLKVNWWQSLTRHILPHNAGLFPPNQLSRD